MPSSLEPAISHAYISGKNLHASVTTIHTYKGRNVRTTIVVHSWDEEGVGMAHDIKSASKPKQAFRSTRNAFKK